MEKDQKKAFKVTRSSMETEKVSVGNNSMEAQSMKVTSCSIADEKLKISTTDTQSLKVNANKDLKETTPAKGNDNLKEAMPDNKQSEAKEKSVQPSNKRSDPVKNINKKKEIWRLSVMVDDIWTVYKGEKLEHIDMVLRDIKGDTIQATINEHQLDQWNGKLSAGNTYYMCNFKVHLNDTGFKYTPHSCRLTFSGATIVKGTEIQGMSYPSFRFYDFAEIKNGKYDPDLLVDAIGVVDSLKKVVNASTTKKANVSFTLKDLRDNVMDCTLWDNYAAEFLQLYSERTDDVPPVLIIKHARIKEANAIYPLQFTNVWNGTKLLIDRNIPHIMEFIKSLPKDVVYPTQSVTPSYSTQYMSQASGGSQYNAHEDFIRKGIVIPLGEITKLKTDTFCVTIATTSHILANQGWYYRGCTSCNCKAEGSEPPFICRKQHKTDEPNIKYKLDVEVYSGDDTAKFVFWDNSLDVLLGLTAATLLKMEQQNGYGDPHEYPTNLDDIMERKFAFRVKWTKEWGGQASVLECQDDPELIAKIQDQLPAAESSLNELEAIQEEVLTLSDSPTNQKFNESDLANFASLDDSILSTPNVSSSTDNGMSGSSQKSTGKRSASKPTSFESVNLEGQFSSTRRGKVIKKEKL